jgi:uncharacterized protein YjiS (DUF1127 family)
VPELLKIMGLFTTSAYFKLCKITPTAAIKSRLQHPLIGEEDVTFQRQELPSIGKLLSSETNVVALDNGNILQAIKSSLGKLFAIIAAWDRGRRAATTLNRLDAHLLADIGLTNAVPVPVPHKYTF